jgi:hypothetical protein
MGLELFGATRLAPVGSNPGLEATYTEHESAALRYLDSFVKADGALLFAERLLYVDWIEERAL